MLRPVSKEDNMLSKETFAEKMAKLRRLAHRPSSTVTSSSQGDDETLVEQNKERTSSRASKEDNMILKETFAEKMAKLRRLVHRPSSTVTSSSQGDDETLVEQNKERTSKRRENDEFDENKSKRLKYSEGLSSDNKINISQEGDRNPVNESHQAVDTTNKKKNDFSKMNEEDVNTEVNKRLKNDTSSKEEFEKSKNMRAPSPRTEGMKSFTNPVPVNRKIDLENLPSIMPDLSKRDDTSVGAADSHSKIVARSKGRCLGGRLQNCLKYNCKIHDTANCPLPYQHKNKIICGMCGKTGHRPKQCPERRCLNCGGPSNTWTSRCNRCKSQYNTKCGRCCRRGHTTQQCSDHWRQYHHSVVPGAQKPVKTYHKKGTEVYCSNCARLGHVYENCKYYSCSKDAKQPVPESLTDRQHKKPEPIKVVLPKTLCRRVKRLNEQLSYALGALPIHPPEYFELVVMHVLRHVDTQVSKYSTQLQGCMQYVLMCLVGIYDVDGGKKKLDEFKDLAVQVSEMTQEFVSKELLQTLQGYYDLIFSANCEVLDIVKLFQKFLIKNLRCNTPLIQKLMVKHKVLDLTEL